MASLSLINLYICANALLILAAVLLTSITIISGKLARPIAYGQQLQLAYGLSLAVVLLPCIGWFSGQENFLPQTAQVWSASTMRDAALHTVADQRIAVTVASSGASMPLDIVSRVAAGLFVAGLLMLLVRVSLDAVTTIRIIASAQAIRRHGRLSILVSERVQVPFSFWLPAQYFIVAPSSLVLRPDDLRIAIRHEAQHHRQHDTKLLYLYQLLKALFFWNPAAHRLEKSVLELQEFACDEALSRQPTISVQAYCQCLLRVAETALQQRRMLLHAGMMGSNVQTVLRRRIEALLTRPATCVRKSAIVATAGAAISAMAVTAFAFTATIQDRRVSMEEAGRMAAVAQQDSAFPIVVNAQVLKQLNLMLGTPDGRAYLQASLSRMQEYKALVSERIAQHGLPPELLAVPLVESGYRNLPRSENPQRGAGLWMFIAPTARHYGLTVTGNSDERMNVPAQTDAAMRMFADLYRRFSDWNLALLAYNVGGARVDKAIRETGSRDAWLLTRNGYENDRDYLARVMAVILIIENPDLLQ